MRKKKKKLNALRTVTVKDSSDLDLTFHPASSLMASTSHQMLQPIPTACHSPNTPHGSLTFDFHSKTFFRLGHPFPSSFISPNPNLLQALPHTSPPPSYTSSLSGCVPIAFTHHGLPALPSRHFLLSGQRQAQRSLSHGSRSPLYHPPCLAVVGAQKGNVINATQAN